MTVPSLFLGKFVAFIRQPFAAEKWTITGLPTGQSHLRHVSVSVSGCFAEEAGGGEQPRRCDRRRQSVYCGTGALTIRSQSGLISPEEVDQGVRAVMDRVS